MGRNKISADLKKKSISIALDAKVYQDLEELNVKSKSQLINWLLAEHFGVVKEGGENA